MAQRVVSTLLDRVREVTRIEQQAEKLAALGKLAGNLAHELNNPASAAQRAAASLARRAPRQPRQPLQARQSLPQRRADSKRRCLGGTVLCSHRREPHRGRCRAAYIAREEALRAWLTAMPCADAWEVAPQLAEQGVTVGRPRRAARLSSTRTEAGSSLQYFARYLRSSRAAETLVNSTARIFDLISAVKDYSNMDRAPILEVDVPAGLDATLQMLRSRMDTSRSSATTNPTCRASAPTAAS